MGYRPLIVILLCLASRFQSCRGPRCWQQSMTWREERFWAAAAALKGARCRRLQVVTTPEGLGARPEEGAIPAVPHCMSLSSTVAAPANVGFKQLEAGGRGWNSSSTTIVCNPLPARRWCQDSAEAVTYLACWRSVANVLHSLPGDTAASDWQEGYRGAS